MEWRNIKGYEGKYMISDTGMVKSILRNERILKKETSSGLNKVTLYNNGNRSTYLVYRLMVKSFYNNLPKHYRVLHLDGDNMNDVLSNLEVIKI
jgi:ACT domain-containing protein